MAQARRSAAWVALLLAVIALSSDRLPRPRLVLWAWERPEDLRFAGRDVEVAAQTGFIILSGQTVFARPRRFPLRLAGQASIHVVHVQIDHRQPLLWTPAQRTEASQAVLSLAGGPGVKQVQVDFEVRRSERQVLLDLLTDVRRGLPPGVSLSMTALASWCETETWLAAAPVEEIVPMLFRMGPGGEALKAKLEAGGDFSDRRCHAALALSADAPLKRAPRGRRTYLFSPRSWTASDYETLRRRIAGWASGGD